MLTKEEWLIDFEQKYNRKPTPKEFLEAKNNQKFISSTQETSKRVEFSNEPIFEEAVANTDSMVELENTEYNSGFGKGGQSLHNEKENQNKTFCFSCGALNLGVSEKCISCGQKIIKQEISASFLGNLTSKLTGLSQLATRRTKELTQNVQTSSQVHDALRRKELLVQTLGNAYYEKYRTDLDGEFQELVTEIKQIDQLIQGLKLSLEHMD